MDQSILQKCQELIDYHFSDPDLLETALTHASVAPTRLQSNERLEFLGDAVLGLVVCGALYSSYDELMEGEMTKMKSSVVSRQRCAAVAEELGICKLLFLGKGMASPERLPQSVAAAVFEAIIGAIYVDGGLEPACKFILEHLQPYLADALADEHHNNFKSLLQQHAQRRWDTTPDYQLLDEKGPDHSKCFEIAAAIAGRQFPSAWGRSKKEAEQKAARRALLALGLLKSSPKPPGAAT